MLYQRAQQAAGLNAAITSRGKSYVGTALTWRRDDDAERRIITPYTEFGSITVENALKWNSVEPNRGRFNWTESDRVVDYAVQNNKYLRCHALIMEDQLPEWVADQSWNNASLLSAMETHIREVVGRYRGRCNSWDVVNNGESVL
jgi:endo-1,4-beta-xylanase